MRSSPRGRGGGESEMTAEVRVETRRERFDVDWACGVVIKRGS